MDKEVAINKTMKHVAYLEKQIKLLKSNLELMRNDDSFEPIDVDFELVGFMSTLKMTDDCIRELHEQF
jgi:hypothetical protein